MDNQIRVFMGSPDGHCGFIYFSKEALVWSLVQQFMVIKNEGIDMDKSGYMKIDAKMLVEQFLAAVGSDGITITRKDIESILPLGDFELQFEDEDLLVANHFVNPYLKQEYQRNTGKQAPAKT